MLTGMAAAEAIRNDFEHAAAKLPFRAAGHVFLQTIRMDDGRYRLYLIDPGWLDPADRDVTLRVQIAEDLTLRDLLSGETIPVRDRMARFRVPAGSLRILEAVPKL